MGRVRCAKQKSKSAIPDESYLRGREIMKSRFFSFSVVFLAAACVFAQTGQKAQPAGEGIPHASAAMKNLLDQAHKTFRRDAVVTSVEVQGVPGLYWLLIDLYSPSNGATMGIWVGGPNDGQFALGHVQPQSATVAIPPNFNADLPEIMASLRKEGLKGPLDVTRLLWAGASGTPPILAWQIRIAGGTPMFFPLFINAQDGKVIPWQRAMDPPDASDAQLRAAWDRLQHRNRPQTGPNGMSAWDCVVQIQETGNCAPE